LGTGEGKGRPQKKKKGKVGFYYGARKENDGRFRPTWGEDKRAVSAVDWEERGL